MIWRPERAKALVSWLTTITTTLSVPFRQWMVTNSKRMATNHSKFLSKRPSGNDKIHLHLSSYFSFTGLVSFSPPLHTFVIHTSVKKTKGFSPISIISSHTSVRALTIHVVAKSTWSTNELDNRNHTDPFATLYVFHFSLFSPCPPFGRMSFVKNTISAFRILRK